MNVETFEVTETDCEGTVEHDEEAIALIKQLGLEGQETLIRVPDKGEPVRLPYRKMTNQERFVYTTICPQRTDLKRYSDGPIPVRVLQVAAHAMQFNLFKKIQVWHQPAIDVKDPVLVGLNGSYEWDLNELFLLARWGEVLIPFNELVSQAAATFRGAYKEACAKIVREATAAIPAIDVMDDLGLSMNPPQIPSAGF